MREHVAWPLSGRAGHFLQNETACTVTGPRNSPPGQHRSELCGSSICGFFFSRLENFLEICNNLKNLQMNLIIFLRLFLFSSFLYCENTYDIQNMCVYQLFMLPARLSVGSRLSAVKFWGVKRDMQIFNCVGFGASKPQAAQSTTVFTEEE